ncbi:MAG: DM13 domain-containing protein [Anaerolineales bacterium]|nr:DM13 domain-containing protein [Anaerolineales bacterium]
MKNQLWFVVVGIVGLALVAPVAWYLASPLFVNKVVEEEFPAQISNSAEAEQRSAEEDKASKSKVVAAAADMPEAVANKEPVLVLAGQFKDGDSFHKGSGQAALYQLPDGLHVLRFEDFAATNGPDLHVILSSHPAPTSSDEVMQGHLDLGSLKGNIGSQNYALPAGTDVSQFKSVIIYCQPFRVIFATAALSDSQ